MIDGELRPSAIRYEDGVIVEIADGPADRDFGDLIVLPGLVDTHVHVNEPGRSDWEGFATATMAAAAGGATTIVDMPLNSIPPTTSVEALARKRTAAEGKLSVDVAFWGGVVPGSIPDILPLAGEGVCGFKMFMADSGVGEFPPMPRDGLSAALARIHEAGRPALIHAESPDLLRPIEDPRAYLDYLRSRPVEAEVDAVTMLSDLAAEAGGDIHILHVSSGEAAAVIGASPMTGETCPHYLTFAAEDIPRGATRFKCAPPIREREHREARWEALGSEALSMVVSDHSPAPASLKAVGSGDFSEAWGGISSLQVRLPVIWSGALTRGFGPVSVADWLSRAPSRLAGLDDRKGSIEVGKDADLVVFNPDGKSVVRGRDLYHLHPITPYEGMELRGSVVETILRGDSVFDGDVHTGRGRMLRRDD